MDYHVRDIGYRYRIRMSIFDGVTEAVVSVFGSCLDQYIGLGASQFNKSVYNIDDCFFHVGAMHFVYYINRPTATKVDSTYLGSL